MMWAVALLVLPLLVSASNHTDYTLACDNVLQQYFSSGTKAKACTVRYDSFQGTYTVYWLIWDCNTWSDASSNHPGKCGIGGGALGSFPTLNDKEYLLRFLDPAVLPLSSDGCGYSGSYKPYLQGVWIGLNRRASSSQRWEWRVPLPLERQWLTWRVVEDGRHEEDQDDLPFNPYSTYYTSSYQKVSSGDCALAAATYYAYSSYSSQYGYRAADCATSARAVCMKTL